MASTGQWLTRRISHDRGVATSDQGPDRSWHDLDAGRGRAERLAVDLERYRRPGDDDQLADLHVGDVGVVVVAAEEHQRQVAKLAEDRTAWEEADVEQAVGGRCAVGDLHSPGPEAGVPNRHQRRRRLEDLAIGSHTEVGAGRS